MNRDKVIEMSLNSGMMAVNSEEAEIDGDIFDFLERFASTVAADEREACLAEVEGIWFDKTTDEVLDSIANAIRARGNK